MTTINCPSCGKQYAYNPQMEGKQVRCQSCSHAFQVRMSSGSSEGLEIIDGPTAVSGRSGGARPT